MTEKDSLRPI